eukprot:TRINITY_DN94347_c0_g1_i1.p1 TRINITY_DN94347_c0_g1~~TRINITY_DN94347_c0_g1_i1.p1  ORF type:complete len:727 (-),score=125.65 TRINITY_DN94347_c0_g1_i1:83-2242(-)
MSQPGTNTTLFEVRPDGIAVITVDHFPVNSLSIPVRQGLVQAMERISGDPSIRGAVLRGAGRTFCAGADITEFGAAAAAGSERVVLGNFDEIPKPIVAAIHGHALGGGLELALKCHFRVANNKAILGLPEVNIGLLPGAEGTQRVPRIIGVEPALQFLTSGDPVPAHRAKQLGLVDEVVDGDPLEVAVSTALKNIGKDLTTVRISSRPAPQAAPEVFANWEKKMAAARRGEVAPINIIRSIRAACEAPSFPEGVQAERRYFTELLKHPQSAALQHIFFEERSAGRGIGNAKPSKISTVGVVGAGTMGGGIAMCFANVGIPVTLVEREERFLENGMATIRRNYERSKKNGRISEAQMQQRLALIRGSVAFADLGDVDMVIEAVFEDMDLKQQIFRQLDATCKPGALLCSNTSALDIDKIASAVKRPDAVMGMHFFSPANVMKLLENVKGANTSHVTIATCMDIGKKIGKWPVLVGNCPGFVGNRMIANYSAEARHLLEEGALPWEVDRVATKFGMAMGPFQMSDLAGLDVLWFAKKKKGLSTPDTDIHDALCEKGRFGQKTSKGWYSYATNNRGDPDPEVEATILQVANTKGVVRRKISDEEILARLFFPLINEGFKILEEGIARNPGDIDVVYVHGYGFPRYRGGPMYFADVDIKLPQLLAGLQRYGVLGKEAYARNKQPVAEAWEPSKLLVDCVDQNMTLAKYWKHFRGQKGTAKSHL